MSTEQIQNENELIEGFLSNFPLISFIDIKNLFRTSYFNFIPFVVTSSHRPLFRSHLFIERKQIYLFSLLNEQETSTFMSYMQFKENINR